MKQICIFKSNHLFGYNVRYWLIEDEKDEFWAIESNSIIRSYEKPEYLWEDINKFKKGNKKQFFVKSKSSSARRSWRFDNLIAENKRLKIENHKLKDSQSNICCRCDKKLKKGTKK